MSYTPPAGDAASVSWSGVAAYTPPAGDAADVSWATGSTAVGAGALAFTGAGTAAHGVSGAGAGELLFTGSGEATFGISVVAGLGAGTLSFAGAGVAAHGAAGAGTGVLAFAGTGAAARGVAGAGVGGLGFAGVGEAQHLRYEVRGEVRLAGVLVNRRVRAYRRLSGVLLGEADTVAGRYRVHAGFDESEVYVTAIDLSGGATDWIPPTANRLVPVLADDTA